ncbi:hypothetical protein ACFL2Q_10260 [Thermodesulfobacteriota bacterium]
MATPFRDFSTTYASFIRRHPDHPLAQEIRSGIGKNRFPEDKWLKTQTKKMKDLMTPVWAKAS